MDSVDPVITRHQHPWVAVFDSNLEGLEIYLPKRFLGHLRCTVSLKIRSCSAAAVFGLTTDSVLGTSAPPQGKHEPKQKEGPEGEYHIPAVTLGRYTQDA